MPLGTDVGIGPGDIVLDGDPVRPPQKGEQKSSNFRPMNSGQTAGWIKMPLLWQGALKEVDMPFLANVNWVPI